VAKLSNKKLLDKTQQTYKLCKIKVNYSESIFVIENKHKMFVNKCFVTSILFVQSAKTTASDFMIHSVFL